MNTFKWLGFILLNTSFFISFAQEENIRKSDFSSDKKHSVIDDEAFPTRSFYPIKKVKVQKWREIGPTFRPTGQITDRLKGTGRLVFIEFDDVNHRMFTGSPLGGLWYSENEGESWVNGGTDYLPEVGVSHMQVASRSNNGETWFIATGDGEGDFNPCNGIWRTTDKGKTYHNLNSQNTLGIGNKFPSFFWSRCRKLLIDPENENVLYAAFLHGLYRTSNALAKDPASVVWEKVVDNSLVKQIFDVAIQPESHGKTVVVSGENLAISYSYGEKGSFGLIPSQDQVKKVNGKKISVRFSKSNPNIFYGASPNWIFKYNLKTKEVLNHRVGGRYQRHQAIGVSPKNENEIWIGNVSPIYQSLDGGKSFVEKPKKNIPYHDDVHWVSCRENGEVWVANDGGLFKTQDTGVTWMDMTNGIGVGVYYNLGISEKLPDLSIGGGWDTGANLTKNKGKSFEVLKAFGDAFESVVDDSDTSNLRYYVSIQGGLVGIDANKNKVLFSNKPSQNIRGGRNWVHSFVKNYQNQKTLFYAGDNYIGRTEDGGFNWLPISDHAKEGNKKRYYSKVWGSKNNPDVLYVERKSADANDKDGFKLFRTFNANADTSEVVWEEVTPSLSETIRNEEGYDYDGISDLVISEKDPKMFWMSVQGFDEGKVKVWRYYGNQLEPLTNDGIEGVQVFSLAYQDVYIGRIYAGTSAGVFYLDPTISEWKMIYGMPHVKVSELEINNCASTLVAATFGRGIWETDLIGREDQFIIKDESWSKPKTLNHTVVIEKGVTLSINNRVNLGENAKIYVQKGGRLVVQERIANECGLNWKGIHVEGRINPIKTWDGIPEVDVFDLGEIVFPQY